MTPDGVRQVQAHLPPGTYRRFLARVAAEGCTRSSLVRRALEQYLTQAETIVSPGRSWELDPETDKY